MTVADVEVLTREPRAVIGGTMREPHLWLDPGPNEDDSDLHTACWTDFTLGFPRTINHIEWWGTGRWGTGQAELGFRIEIWKQDPNTIAYQPLAFFCYGAAVPRRAAQRVG